MQTTDNKNLPKRSRYYQGMIDLNLIERGADYNELKKSYIIFICPFDYFGEGLHRYTFINRCVESPELELGDDATKIFLCAGGDANDVSPELADFLKWIATGNSGESQLVQELEAAVESAKLHEEWRLEYMTLLMRDQVNIEKGKHEMIFTYVQNGRFSVEQGAEDAGMSVEEFKKRMSEAGYKVPELV